MTDSLDRTISTLANSLMTAVVRSGCIRAGNEADVTLASVVMRQEMKLFIVADHDATGKYADERALVSTGNSGLAMASLVAECIKRIATERAA